MSRHRQLLVVIALAGFGVFAAADAAPPAGKSPAGKKKKTEKADPALGAVESVLRAEVVGEVDRRKQLADALDQHPDSPAARWQAGFVRDGNGWRSFDQPPAASAESEAVRRYLARRDETPQTFAAQLDLANWCRKQDLFDQERAHLFAAASQPTEADTTEILGRLGYRRAGGIWLSPDDLREWQRVNRATEASLKQWETRLNGIATGLSGSPRQRDAAVAKLRAITDPTAIPAMELVLAGRDETTALAAVDVFKRINSPESSLALAKQGVFSQWPEVRNAANQALKSRKLEEFVPPLISLLATPVRTRLTLEGARFRDTDFSGPVVLYFTYVLARETGDQLQVATFRTSNYVINDAVNWMYTMGPDFRGSRGNNVLDFGLARGQLDAWRATAAVTEQRERVVADANEQSRELNQRIGTVLAAVSGEDAAADAKTWWKWWQTASDTQQSGNKQVVEVSEDETIGNPFSPGIHIESCFAAGTPVWTERGALAIEQVKVGDRVLSQDVETGELVYKPVLQTTVRPPKDLTTLRVGNETIVCTGGHRFWNSGSGWVMARDLAPQTLLHTATGNIPVWAAKKGETAQTYNLVVADFHSYFVGKTGVFCQDLLIPRGTHSIVPGLARTDAAAPAKGK